MTVASVVVSSLYSISSQKQHQKGTIKMKKRVCLFALTVFVLVTSMPLFAVAEELHTAKETNQVSAVEDRFGDSHEAYEERLYGDLNMDWKLDALDYMLVKRAVLGTYSIPECDMICADINKNGKIDAADYLLIKRSILGTFGSLGIVQEELTPNRYASLTDEELYALIDEELAADAEPEGANILMVSFQRIKRESQASEVLSELGFSGDLNDNQIYLHVGHMTGMYMVVVMTVPSEQLREAIFKLRRCEEIADCLTHGNEYSYPV